jgi:FkbM family methyltransferase
MTNTLSMPAARLRAAGALKRVIEWLPQRPQLAIERAYYRATHEPELRLLGRLCSRDKLSIDVGANKGIYSLFLLHYSARLVSVEPNPMLSAYLERKFHGLNAEVMNCAFGSTPGRTSLAIPYVGSLPLHGWASVVAGFDGSEWKGQPITRTDNIEVDVKRLDDLDFRDVGLVKIDVEGFEPQVLDGARETLRRDRPNLLMEVERRLNPDMDSTLEGVTGMGYEGYFLHDRAVHPLADFDPGSMQQPGDIGDFRTHVSNFIFVPTGTGDQVLGGRAGGSAPWRS